MYLKEYGRLHLYRTESYVTSLLIQVQCSMSQGHYIFWKQLMPVRRKEQAWPMWDSCTPPGSFWGWSAVMEAGYKMVVCAFSSIPLRISVEESHSQGFTVLDSLKRALDFMEHIVTGKYEHSDE